MVEESPSKTLCVRYGFSSGSLQELRAQATGFAGMMASFCYHQKWNALLHLVSRVYSRLKHGGVQHDIVPLMEVNTLGRRKLLKPMFARALFNAGLTTLDSLASAPTAKVEDILMKVVPFEVKHNIASLSPDFQIVYDSCVFVCLVLTMS